MSSHLEKPRSHNENPEKFSGRTIVDHDFHDQDLDHEDFTRANLIDDSFDGADLTGSHFERTVFLNSELYNAHVGSIDVNGTVVDLESGSIRLSDPDSRWNVHGKVAYELGICPDCEQFNNAVLSYVLQEAHSINPDRAYTRRGIVLFQEGHPLGYLKLKGERSFTAMRTVRNGKGEVIFFKGMVYELDEDVRALLEIASRKHIQAEEWRRADIEDIVAKLPHVARGEVLAVRKQMHRNPDDSTSAEHVPLEQSLTHKCFVPEGANSIRYDPAYEHALEEHLFERRAQGDWSLSRNNLRFINDAKLFDKLTELTERIEGGEETFVDILK